MYRLEFRPTAARGFRQLDDTEAAEMQQLFGELCEEPYPPPDVDPHYWKDLEGYRRRFRIVWRGDPTRGEGWRILYRVIETRRVVQIEYIGPRGGAYREHPRKR